MTTFKAWIMNSFTWRRCGITCLIGVAIGLAGVGWFHESPSGQSADETHAADKPSESNAKTTVPVKVDVVKPHPGGLDRISTQPSSMHAYEATQLFANISGYLDKLYVDIGDRVTAGQTLIVIAAPEYLREVDSCKAAVDRAQAQVGQMQAQIITRQADLHAAETGISQAEAAVKRDTAAADFRQKQFRRFRELANDKSIDERLVDEKEEQLLAAQAAVDASRANLAEAHALVEAAAAKLEAAKADLRDAEARVEVAQADLAKAKVFAEYTLIKAPYDGVVSFRGFVRGDFIRAAGSGVSVPLLTVERTDVLRLVIYMPDTDVPFTDPGDDTVTEIVALPGKKFPGKVSRVAVSEDMKTRTMRTEVDLPNETGLLRNGMYGVTRLILQRGNPHSFTVPSTATSGGAKSGKGTVFTVRDGKAHKTEVTIATDDGVNVEITEGLTADDLVIVGNNNSVTDGRKVETHLVAESEDHKK